MYSYYATASATLAFHPNLIHNGSRNRLSTFCRAGSVARHAACLFTNDDSKRMTTVVSARSESLARHLNPLTLARNLWRQRSLIRQFTRREIVGRYKGSFLGLFWSFVNPLV